MTYRHCFAVSLRALALVFIALGMACTRQPADSTNLILITVDAMRADTLGPPGEAAVRTWRGGQSHSLTPNIDRFAARSVRFENAISSFVGTTASMPSLVSGRLPNLIDIEGWTVGTWHGFSDLNDQDEKRGITRNLYTLAEALRDRGYLTAGFSNNANISKHVGFDQGFLYWSSFQDHLAGLRKNRRHSLEHAYTRADMVLTRVCDWLQTNAQQPFFLWFHLMETHSPYLPPAPFKRLAGRRYAAIEDPELNQILRHFNRSHAAGTIPDLQELPEALLREHVRALYEGEVRFVDSELGRLLDQVEQLALQERTVVVFTADHGEELFDHGRAGHHLDQPPLEELIRIPLLVCLPSRLDRRGGRNIEQLVRMIDLAPTMLDYLGADDATVGMDGVSLRPLIEGDALAEQPAFISSIPFHTVRTRRWKYHLVKENAGRFPAGEVLLDLAADPRCTSNVAAQHPEVLARLRAEHDRVVAHLRRRGEHKGQEEEATLDAEELEMLRDLGYVE